MRKLLVAGVVVLCGASIAWAQDSAGVSGRVMDPSGAVIAGADMVLTNMATGIAARAASDSSGEFAFMGLPGGTYTLAASKSGFAPFQRDNLQLQPGQTLTSDVTMELLSVGQSVVVVGGAIPGATPQPTQQQVFDSNLDLRVLDRTQMDMVGPIAGAAQIVSVAPGASVTGYGNSGATKYTVMLNGISQGWGGYGGFTGGASLGITFDGVPIVDPATSLWQSPTIPQTDMIQDTKVTYGPGDPADRWYTNVGGSIEFTPVQPSNQPHGDVTLTYGSYNQKNIEFNLASGVYHGWSTVLSAGGGLGDDFRQSPDGFGNYSKDYAINSKTVKSFQDNSFEIGGYFAHSGGYRAQVIPTAANPGITINGQPGSPMYSQQTSGFYSSLPYDSYNKYDTNQMGLIYARENVHVDDTTTLRNMSWFMNIGRTHDRLDDVYSLGPQQNEWNDPHTNTIGDQVSLTKRLPWNTVDVGGYYIHGLYNSRNNFYNPADGGDYSVVNIGGKIRSSYFNQDDFALSLQDDIHPVSFLHITPGIRYVGFQTGYSDNALQDFSFAPGVLLSSHCPSNQSSTPGNTTNQGASCANQQNRSGAEPSLDVSARALSWLSFYGGFFEELRAPEVGGGGGLFQSVDPATYHLARGEYTQGGFKIHFEGSGWRHNLLLGAAYYHTTYADQEIDVGLANGNEVSANGTSAYHGVNIFFEDDPIGHLHVFANANAEGAKYTSYVTGGVSYNGSPVPYVPSSTVNAGAYYQFTPRKGLIIEPMAAFQFVGAQHLFDNTTVAPSNQTMSSYGTVNLGIKVPFKFFELELTALNVLNKQYNEYAYISSGGYFGTPTGGYTLAYPAAPFTMYGGVKFHF